MSQGCKGIGDSATLVDAIRGAPHKSCLRWLDLSWVNAASPEVVEEIIALCPEARVKDYYGDAYDITTAGNTLEMLRQAGEACVAPAAGGAGSTSPRP